MSVHLSVCSSVVRPSVFSFLDDNGSKYQWTFTKLGVCIDIRRLGFGFLMGKFRQFLTELSAHNMPEFLFPDDNVSKCQWIFTKLGVCIDILKIWFGIADVQFLTELSACHMSVVSVLDDNFSKYQWSFTRLGICIALILWRSASRLLMGKSSIFVRVICPQYICSLLSGQ